MARTKSDQYKNWKVVLLWFLGAVCILIGSLIAGNVDSGLGTTPQGFILSLFIGLMFFLVGGIFWIAVAIAIKELEER